MLLWFGPFLFLPMRSAITLVSVPLILERLLSPVPHHWSAGFHYSAPLAPILAMAAADGLARITLERGAKPSRPRLRLALVGMIVVCCAVLPGKLPLWRLLSPRFYELTEVQRAGHEALRLIPKEASVVAQDAVASHLSQRADIFTLTPQAPRAQYVVACRHLSPWPNPGWAEIESYLTARKEEGYGLAYEGAGWVILRAGSDGSGVIVRRRSLR